MKKTKLTPKLSVLDEQRVSSMADEGGVSAVALEEENKADLDTEVSRPGFALSRTALASSVVLAIGAGLGWYWAKSRKT